MASRFLVKRKIPAFYLAVSCGTGRKVLAFPFEIAVDIIRIARTVVEPAARVGA